MTSTPLFCDSTHCPIPFLQEQAQDWTAPPLVAAQLQSAKRIESVHGRTSTAGDVNVSRHRADQGVEELAPVLILQLDD